MKKIFITMFLSFAIVFAVGQTQAEAREVYVGSYSDGTSVYLLTETVQRRSWARAYGYDCRVRAGRSYLNYTFWLSAGDTWRYENSEGYQGHVYDGSSPVAARICEYLRNNF